MSRAISPSAGKPYGLGRVCRLWEVPRSTMYAQRVKGRDGPRLRAKRGPKSCMDDAELTAKVRESLAASQFHGEG